MTRGESAAIHLASPTRKAKNLGFFHMAWHWVDEFMPIVGEEPANGGLPQRNLR